jgi:hypothetical protein
METKDGVAALVLLAEKYFGFSGALFPTQDTVE